MQSSTTDPYDVLGVPANATLAQIKRAYREKASWFHPDRNPDPRAAAQFREAQTAYELLADHGRRREWDLRRQKHLLDDPQATARGIFQSYLEGIE